MIVTATPGSAEAYALGEGPVWDPVQERLLWVDIVAGTVHEGILVEGKVRATVRHAVDTTVGAVAVSADGDLIVAGQSTLIHLGADGSRAELARVLPADIRSRLNDGGVDPAGRFLVGSLAQDDRHGREVLARLDSTGVTFLDTDLVLSNGLAGAITAYADGSVDARPLVAATVGLAETTDILAGHRPPGAGPGPKIHIDPGTESRRAPA
jgi:sugar lactone lactonase YvrE